MTKAQNMPAPPRLPYSSVPDAFGLYDPRFEHDT